MFVFSWIAAEKFRATLFACQNIFDYYTKINEEAQAQTLCYAMFSIYAGWLAVNIMLTILRCMSLYYMLKSYRFLFRKREDKKRRKLHLKEKKRKLKRSHKRDV
jgi:uncharacterized membrane protein